MCLDLLLQAQFMHKCAASYLSLVGVVLPCFPTRDGTLTGRTLREIATLFADQRSKYAPAKGAEESCEWASHTDVLNPPPNL